MMEKREVKYFPILLCLVQFFIASRLVESADHVVKKVSLELLWEKKLDFTYDWLDVNETWTRFIFHENIRARDHRYVVLDSEANNLFIIEPASPYGNVAGKIKSIINHPDYLAAKKNNTLSSLDLVIDETIHLSENLQYLGVVQQFYDKSHLKFDKRFRLFKLDEHGNRTLQWELPSCCEDQPWHRCLGSFCISASGHILLWQDEKNKLDMSMLQKISELYAYDAAGRLILKKACENCSCMTKPGFDSDESFHIIFESCLEMRPASAIKRREVHFFDFTGRDITAIKDKDIVEKYTKHANGEKVFTDLDMMPFNPQTLTDNVNNYKTFFDNGEKYFVAIRENTIGPSWLYLYNADKKKIEWIHQIEENSNCYHGLAVSRNGDLIFVGKEERKVGVKYPSVYFIFNKNGEVISTLNETGFVEISPINEDVVI